VLQAKNEERDEDVGIAKMSMAISRSVERISVATPNGRKRDGNIESRLMHHPCHSKKEKD